MVPPVDRPPAATTVLDLQHEEHPEFFGRAELRYRKVVYGWTIRRSRIVITISEHARQTLIERYRLAPDRVRAIYLAVDPERFELVAVPQSPEAPYLVYPARPWPHKNHARLYEAFALLRRERPELRLVLTGEGDYGALPQGVEARGRVSADELVSLYRGAAALVFPSLYEGFGMPVVEAMASGTPVAAAARRRSPRSPATPHGCSTRATRRRSPRRWTTSCAIRRRGSSAASSARSSSRGTRAHARTTRSTPSSPPADGRGRAARARRPRASARAPRTAPRRPAETLARLRRVADEVVQLRLAALQRLVDVHVLAPVEPDVLERGLHELLDAVQLAGRDHVVVRLVLLEHQPHRAHGVAGVAPVALRVEVAEPQVGHEAELDPGGRVRDLARQELERAARRLVVVEDPRRGVQAVAAAVAARDEVRVRLRDAVRRQRRSGVVSVCGVSTGSPKISDDEAW